MVFKEIEASPEEIIFHSYGDITITVPLIRQYWNPNGLTHVHVFHDEENKKVGLKPSKDKGYKLYKCGRSWRICVRPLTRIVTGTFKPEWNEKLGMLIIDYGKERTN